MNVAWKDPGAVDDDFDFLSGLVQEFEELAGTAAFTAITRAVGSEFESHWQGWGRGFDLGGDGLRSALAASSSVGSWASRFRFTMRGDSWTVVAGWFRRSTGSETEMRGSCEGFRTGVSGIRLEEGTAMTLMGVGRTGNGGIGGRAGCWPWLA